jgi:hypothetical protein
MTSLANINLGAGRTAIDIVAGQGHTCAILDNSTLKCWGLNANGQLGQGSSITLGDGTGEMAGLAAVNLGAGFVPYTVKVGNDHTCVMGIYSGNMTTKCFGMDNFGQLGLGYAATHTAIGTSAAHMGTNLALVPECKFGYEIIDTDVHSRKMASCLDSSGSNTLLYSNAVSVCGASFHVCSLSEYFSYSVTSPSTQTSWISDQGFGTNWATSSTGGSPWSSQTNVYAPVSSPTASNMCGATFINASTTPAITSDRCTQLNKSSGAFGTMCCPN